MAYRLHCSVGGAFSVFLCNGKSFVQGTNFVNNPKNLLRNNNDNFNRYYKDKLSPYLLKPFNFFDKTCRKFIGRRYFMNDSGNYKEIFKDFFEVINVIKGSEIFRI